MIVPAKLIHSKPPGERKIGDISEHQQRILLFAVVNALTIDGDFSVGQFCSLLFSILAVVYFPQIFIEIILIFVNDQTGVRCPVSFQAQQAAIIISHGKIGNIFVDNERIFAVVIAGTLSIQRHSKAR